MLSKKLAAIDKTRCVACGVCENTCPLGAVKVRCGCYAAVQLGLGGAALPFGSGNASEHNPSVTAEYRSARHSPR